MTALATLWLPILVSAVFVFIASSVIHMFLPWHKSDYPKMPNEEKAMDALRPLAIPPGDYMVPRPANMKDMKSPEFTEKMKRGPVMMVRVLGAAASNTPNDTIAIANATSSTRLTVSTTPRPNSS